MPHIRRLIALSLGFAVLAPAIAYACIWNSHTIEDEIHQQGVAEFDLISGQFAHHGPAFFEALAKRAQARLAADPDDLTAHDDLATAYLKLGRFKESHAELKRVLTLHPERYESLSNLGVLYKYEGQFEQAAASMQQALAIKPSGHMGLGDWYVRSLEYRAHVAAGRPLPKDATFLDFDPANKDSTGYQTIEEQLHAMIRNDRKFADVYVTLGDQLGHPDRYNHALWCYVHALQLGHTETKRIEKNIDHILDYWKQSLTHNPSPKTVDDRATTIAAITAQLEKAGEWVQSFERVEAEMLAAGEGGESVESVSFETVEAEMKRRGIERYRPTPAGVRPLVTTESVTSAFWITGAVAVAFVGVAVLGLGVFLIVRRQRKAA